ncbi:hypothetical protein RHGRI_017330 [Rhododendron griersonianum]|uniref:Wall-associated receptor kinase galacturonan-binding domain-containing protein n=1 Tax=Rhododendron griersonianum TaxID=479676 RepID=A0AAV6JXD9_9ERIC|nr:hypothetical protein RHGRI_017330 [Rhododendron griersonianum]
MSTNPIVFFLLLPCSLSLSPLLMSSRRLVSDVYKTHSLLLVVALFLGNCWYAQTSPNCVSSCGNIHNISHPFRVKGDPKNCGNKTYELECDRNRLVLNLNSSAKYYVQAINYNNYTIRLVDVGLQQGNCSSLPLYYLSDLNFTSSDAKPYSLLHRYERIYSSLIDPIPWNISVALWVDCKKPVIKSPFYTGSNTSASSCIRKSTSSSSSLSSGEKGHYSYFLFGTNLGASDVADQCKIDEIVMSTLKWPADKGEANLSFSDFHSRLEYGFELSWLFFPCSEICQGRYCNIGFNYNVTCDEGYIYRCNFPCRLVSFYYGDPDNCGNANYELVCQNNRPMLSLFPGKWYHVKAINYSDHTIRLVDVGVHEGNCSSLPLHSLSVDNFTSDYNIGAEHHKLSSFLWEHTDAALFVACEKPVISPQYVDVNNASRDCSINRDVLVGSSSSHDHDRQRYSNYIVPGDMRAGDLADHCRVDKVFPTMPRPGSRDRDINGKKS